MVYKTINEGGKPLIIFAASQKILLDRYERMARKLGCSARMYDQAEEAAYDLNGIEDVLAVVTDENMPGMKGSVLLGVVAATKPHALRVHITRDADLHDELRWTGVADHYLLKPKDDAEKLMLLLTDYVKDYDEQHK